MRKIWIIPAIGIAAALFYLFTRIYIHPNPIDKTANSGDNISKAEASGIDTTSKEEHVKHGIFSTLDHKIFATVRSNTLNLRKYIIGISLHGESKAYPIQFLAFHHNLCDTVGGQPIFITYCALCRSGRVYKPMVDDQYTTFDLVGWNDGNSLLEDHVTKSKWRQEDGKAIDGPMRGEYLEEIPFQQLTLSSWIRLHPNTRILQRDSDFNVGYASMSGFGGGWIKNSILGADTISWRPKSWIIGVLADEKAKAYDWKSLKRVRVVNDTVGKTSDVVLVEPDMKSFHVYDRKVGGKILTFQPSNGVEFLYDKQTHSIWNYYGECTEGPLKGKRLTPLRAYQEFLESWCTFHPNTTRMTIAG